MNFDENLTAVSEMFKKFIITRLLTFYKTQVACKHFDFMKLILRFLERDNFEGLIKDF